MARPREYDAHKLDAYQFYVQQKAAGGDDSALNIRVLLEVAHPEGTASYRTIANWVKGFKNEAEWRDLLDSPFQWHLIEEYGLPWEASGYIMDILLKLESWRVDQREWKRDHPDVVTTPYLSVREALWCWRIHLAAPEIGVTVGELGDIYYLARQFSSREVTTEILGKPLNLADLEALLMYKPWLDFGGEEKRHRAYHSAVEQGSIPGLPSDKARAMMPTDMLNATPVKALGDKPAFARRHVPGIVGYSHGDHPELLTSQSLYLWLETVGDQE